MRYYVVSDIHGYFSEFHHALTQAGYFNDTEPHKLILLGDLFDRGREAKKIESFVLDLLDKDEIILIRGNHEDLFEELVIDDHGTPYKHHRIPGAVYREGVWRIPEDAIRVSRADLEYTSEVELPELAKKLQNQKKKRNFHGLYTFSMRCLCWISAVFGIRRGTCL